MQLLIGPQKTSGTVKLNATLLKYKSFQTRGAIIIDAMIRL